MSLTSKITFGASLLASVGIIGYVHYKQQLDRENLHRGVLRDVEQQQMKKAQNLYILEQQKTLTTKYKEIEKGEGL